MELLELRGKIVRFPGSNTSDDANVALSAYLDGEADQREAALAEWHLANSATHQQNFATWSADVARLRQLPNSRPFEVTVTNITRHVRLSLFEQPRNLNNSKRLPKRLALSGMAIAFACVIASMVVLTLPTLPQSPNLQPALANTVQPLSRVQGAMPSVNTFATNNNVKLVPAISPVVSVTKMVEKVENRILLVNPLNQTPEFATPQIDPTEKN